ncbi:MAG: hypothetical protein MI923_29455 [Phycisphaerales bacterium]|nr:hypothetical protein [Phycisphaerales bacterium]
MEVKRGPSFSTRFLGHGWCLIFATAVVLGGVALQYPRYEATFAESRVVSDGLSRPDRFIRRVFFADPDDYMRTWRAKKIAAGQTFRVRHIPEINHPGGVELHWTVVMDYVLAGAGILAMPLTDHPDPIGVAAAFVPVGLGGLYVVCLMGWLRRGFGWGPALLAGLFVVVSPAFHRAFQLGHPDHHAMLELLFVIAVGAWIPRRRGDGAPDDPTRRSARVSGLAIGLAIWISSQALLVWGAILVGVNYACRCGDVESRSKYLSARFSWNLSVAIVVAVGFLVENWPDLHVVTIDKVSTVHLALMVIAFLIPGVRRAVTDQQNVEDSENTRAEDDVVTTRQQRQTTQTIALLAAVAAFTVWMAVVFDNVVTPISRPELTRWHDRVAELQPLYAQLDRQWILQPLHEKLGYVPYAMLLFLPLFLMSKRVPAVMKGILGLLAPVLVGLTLWQVRWMDHYNVAVAPVVVLGLWDGFHRFFKRSPTPKPILHFALTGVVLGVLTFPASRGVLARPIEQVNALAKRTDFVAQSITNHEKKLGPSDPGRRAIICEEGEGPMLLYYTGLPVVAAPYHRAIDAIVNTARFYSERDPEKARRQLDELGVRYIVMPAQYHQQLRNFEYIVHGQEQSIEVVRDTINASGRVEQELRALPGFGETMVFRLVNQPAKAYIPGVQLIGRIDDDPRRPQALRGLLYVVNELEVSQ